MKRHRYLLKKYVNTYTEERELLNLSLKFFVRAPFIPSVVSLAASFILVNNFLPNSKIKSYCMVTGRIRFPITLAACSRHVFYSRAAFAETAGFVMSSW